MSDDLITRVVNNYNPAFAFAYGSGAFPQEGHNGEKQIDFIFAVENPYEWHKENFRKHKKDYSLLGRIVLKNEKIFNKIQNMGADIWYHTFIPFEGEEIKYGVMSLEALERDLEHWDKLYVAGRLQKPVNKVRSTQTIDELITKNQKAALNLSLLMLPEQFTAEQLYTTIASISYIGDSRMAIGENPQKVQNIVSGNISGFEEIYLPIIEASELEVGEQYIRKTKQNSYYFGLLHPAIKIKEDQFWNLNKNTNLEDAIIQIVKKPTKGQTVKGIVTSGILKSLRYVAEKIGKRFQRNKKNS